MRVQATGLIEFALGQAEQKATFLVMETSLIARVMALARAVVVLFLLASERRERSALEPRVVLGGRTFRMAPAEARSLLTWFGVVRYQRTYLRKVVKPGSEARGFHPLDAALGLLSDRVSPAVLGMAVRLATRMSFKEAREQLGWFLPTAPSVEVIEAALLGYGRHTQAWFADALLAAGDGEVLVIQIDSKGIPTATDEELRKRRGKRGQASQGALAAASRPGLPQTAHEEAATEEGRQGEEREDEYDGGDVHADKVGVAAAGSDQQALLCVFASFAPKRHAFDYARREATRRGFPPGTGRTIQVVTDGDNDLGRYTAEFFPAARHTVDIAHVVEKLWDVGSSLHREGSSEHHAWVEKQKTRLYADKASSVAAELERHLARVPPTGPGNKFRREKLAEVWAYLAKRLDQMNYGELRRLDFEIGSGQVEGAIKALMYRRHGPRRHALDQGARRGAAAAPLHRRERRLASLHRRRP